MIRHFTLPEEGGLLKNRLSSNLVHVFEKIPAEVYDDPQTAGEKITEELAKAIKSHKGASPFKLGLTTGRTPTVLYPIICKWCADGRLSFKNVEIFAIDEYYPISGSETQSRSARLHAELIDHIDIPADRVHIPDGTVEPDKMAAYCERLDSQMRGMDLVIMGFGLQGQVGFNEIGTPIGSRTRTVMLSYKTRKIQSRNFNHDVKVTPKTAITAGMDTLMSAKRILLMGWGEDKADAMKNIVEADQNPACPASLFQGHCNVTMYSDRAAAKLLTRFDHPWLVGSCDWTLKLRRKAVLWLCEKVGKPILKLSYQDYIQNSLEELLELHGPYNELNVKVFRDLQSTITGWPGGKSEKTHTVLVFSPHPDDDVISMGGTLIRFAHQGHNVHIAYETSGDLAVHDDVVLQHMDAAFQLGFGDNFAKVKKIIDSKCPGAPEPKELLALKAAIRRSEARGAVRSFGLDDSHAHFLNLPFYESGGVTKLPCTQKDVDIIKDLLCSLKPDTIFMAGDLADPHGTHRVCTEAALEAITQCREEGMKWAKESTIWLYRGAWMEWNLDRVDMSVPLSPEEVVEKRHAIYHHLSQKDIVPFPGDDSREFWQRAEDRTQHTAELFDSLGMAEYQAMEVFVKL
ncbi:MAG: 6-phosphogluconolactonase [Bacteroidales bacterium]|nr:6-phosphogluconolactonase [Bacteroidales bacterium]